MQVTYRYDMIFDAFGEPLNENVNFHFGMEIRKIEMEKYNQFGYTKKDIVTCQKKYHYHFYIIYKT